MSVACELVHTLPYYVHDYIYMRAHASALSCKHWLALAIWSIQSRYIPLKYSTSMYTEMVNSIRLVMNIPVAMLVPLRRSAIPSSDREPC